MTPLVSLPSPATALRAAALEELRGVLEAIRCSARLAAREPLPQRERCVLLLAIEMAAARAERAVCRLEA